MNEILQKHRRYVMPCHPDLFVDEPLLVVSGRGNRLVDAEGKEYIDFFAGHGAAIYGYGNSELVTAIDEQAKKLMFCPPDIQTIPIAELAEKLASINNLDLQKSFFLNSGSEAVEAALYLARKHTRRFEFVALYGAFHGRTYGARSATSWSALKKNMGPYLPGFTHIPSANCYRCYLGLEYPDCSIKCADFLDNAIKYELTGDAAAFIAEPIVGDSVIVPPPEYFKIVKKTLDRHNILFIADEVITGVGRTGKLFAMEHFGVKPDILVTAKGLGGGFPVSAIMATDEVAQSYEPGDYFTTFGGSPLACTVALASVNFLLREELIEKADRMGDYMMKLLRELQERHEIIGDVRGKGLFIGVDMVKDRGSKEPAAKEAMKLRYEARRRGLIVAAGAGWLGNCIRLKPPLTITKEEIEEGVQILDDSLKIVSSS